MGQKCGTQRQGYFVPIVPMESHLALVALIITLWIIKLKVCKRRYLESTPAIPSMIKSVLTHDVTLRGLWLSMWSVCSFRFRGETSSELQTHPESGNLEIRVTLWRDTSDSQEKTDWQIWVVISGSGWISDFGCTIFWLPRLNPKNYRNSVRVKQKDPCADPTKPTAWSIVARGTC